MKLQRLITALTLQASLVYGGGHAPASFDYVILGGGTCGLVLANRLSEDPTVTVAVVEAGESQKSNPNVTNAFFFFGGDGTNIDWQYPISPQPWLHQNRTLIYNSGKALGGSSDINGATYVRAQKAQIDAWEQMGNTGWNWNSLFPYYLKTEHFQPPSADIAAKGAQYDPLVHGLEGPLDVGFSPFIEDAFGVLNETFTKVGIPHTVDQSGGDVHGFSVFPSTINVSAPYRADAATSYLFPVESRTNLHVFTGTLAEKIIWANGGSGATASAVNVRPIAGGASYLLNVNREVIVSAGSHKSPVILENSGIGNPGILSKFNIPVKVNLPQVGENLQDQPQFVVNASASTPYGPFGYTPYLAYPTAADLFGSNVTNIANHVLSQIPANAVSLSAAANNATSPGVIEAQLRIQADLIFNKSVPCSEILMLTSPNAVSGIFWGLLPFSRGNTHLSSTDADSNPDISVKFLIPGIDWDVIASTASGNLIRKLLHTSPLGDMILNDSYPSDADVPTGSGDEAWLPFFQATAGPNNHPVGTCAMMAQDFGGVVSPELKVYGTNNVRVVDASVLPFQIDGHLTSTLYALSERAADIIRGNELLAPVNARVGSH